MKQYQPFVTVVALVAMLVAPGRLGAVESFWGLRASLDVNVPGKFHTEGGGDIKVYKPGAGLTVGAVYNTTIASTNFYFEPGLSAFYDTYRWDDIRLGPDSKSFNPRVTKIGVRVPLSVGYRFDLWEKASLLLFTGPELSYGFKGRVSLPKELDGTMEKNIFAGSGGQRRFDCAWTVGAGLDFGTYTVALSGAFGLADLQKNDVRFHDNRISLVLGLNF